MRYLILVVLLFFSCSQKEVIIEHFDSQAWKNDSNGCSGDRMEQIDLLLDNKEYIQGLDSDEVLLLLGKPDNMELYTRSQKFYHYHLTPGPGCKEANTAVVFKLILRFNATGLVKEVSLYD